MTAPAGQLQLTWARPDRLGLTILAGVWGMCLAWGWLARPADVDESAAAQELAHAVREKIDPNTASAASLRRLGGIGPVRAEAIVRHRRQAPPGRPAYRYAEDLQVVSGIGPETVKRIRPDLALPASQPAGNAAPWP